MIVVHCNIEGTVHKQASNLYLLTQARVCGSYAVYVGLGPCIWDCVNIYISICDLMPCALRINSDDSGLLQNLSTMRIDGFA